MIKGDGISFLFILKDASPDLVAHVGTIIEVCNNLNCEAEIVVFHQSKAVEIGKIASQVKSIRQIQCNVANFEAYALKTGIKSAKFDRMVVCFSNDITTAHGLQQMILGLDHFDLVCGIRPVIEFGLRSTVYRWTWHKLVRILFDIRLKDINCPYKAFLRSRIEKIGFLESDGSLTHTELLGRSKAVGMKVAEFPIESFRLESDDSETYGVFVLLWTLYRLIRLKIRIAKTKKRLANESDFHDVWASTMNVDSLMVKESFEAITAIENRHALKAMGDIKGKKILDLGCGAGESSVYFALKGANVTAADISSKMLEVVEHLALKWHVKVDTKVVVGENMDFPGDLFDYVFGNGVLHHLDREKAYNEILRVLKPGGKAVFVEPLCYNPIISVYRLIAKTVRTKNERPFKFKDFRHLERLFERVEHTEFWLVTQLIFIYFFLIKRANPRKERYWKKVIAEADSLAPMYIKLLRIDNYLLSRIPLLRRFCWNTVVVLEKATCAAPS